jgi:hypothetical protein
MTACGTWLLGRLNWITLASVILVTGTTLTVSAQDDSSDAVVTPDPPGRHHATGFVEVDKDQYRSFDRVPVYRAFLPSKIDLSKKFPTPGDQGQLGSCTAWAVGYAARSYYSV